MQACLWHGLNLGQPQWRLDHVMAGCLLYKSILEQGGRKSSGQCAWPRVLLCHLQGNISGWLGGPLIPSLMILCALEGGCASSGALPKLLAHPSHPFLPSPAAFFQDCISEQDLDEMNIEIIRNTLYKVEPCVSSGGLACWQEVRRGRVGW